MSSNQLLAAALLSSLGLGFAGHKAIESKSQPRKGRQGRSVQSNGTNGMYPTNRSDLAVRPPDLRSVPRSVPRHVASLVTWDTCKFDTTIVVSTSSVVETNFSFQLAQNPQSGSWTNLFDQYTVVQASVSFRSEYPGGGTFSPPLLYTALDFDNTASISTIAAIEDYSTCEIKTISPGATVTRTVRPCCKAGIAASNGGTVYSAGCERVWIDSGSANNVNFYGIRSIVSQCGSAFVILATTTVWYAFRNQI
jgi:hypothetical protein